MKYAVAWKPSAEQELTRLWGDAVDRAAITEAANALDHDLAADPYRISESRTGATRIAFEAPLAVLFEVDQTARVVDVLKV